MTVIELEKVFNEKGKYLGSIVIHERDLSPEFLANCKKEASGWKKYRKVMKEAGFDIEP